VLKVNFDVADFVKDLTDIQLKQMPFAVSQALNDSMFDIRQAWMTQIGTVFDRPTPLTINAVLYTKSTKDNLVAQVYIRNEVAGGTSPAQYLQAEVAGGQRLAKPFENRLRNAGLLDSSEYIVPAKGFPLDQFGNIPATTQRTILSDLQALNDPQGNSTSASRAARLRRKNVGKNSTYFESAPVLSASQGKHQPLPRGIYQKTRSGSGSKIRMVMAIVKTAPRYNKRFDASALAQQTFDAVFEGHFTTRLNLAVLGQRRV
jgi:hypothetical protein